MIINCCLQCYELMLEWLACVFFCCSAVLLFQLVMATFDVSEFVANPSLAQLDAYRKKIE